MYFLEKTIVEPTFVGSSVMGEFIGGQMNVIVAKTNVISVYQITQTNSLILVDEVKLNSQIVAIQIIDQSLFVAFPNAKMATVVWNPSTRAMQTISLHYYHQSSALSPILLADPASQTIAYLFNNSCAILNLSINQTTNAVHPSFIINLKQKHQIQNIVDVCFLNDYLQPTLAILFEFHQTTTSRLAILKDTQTLAVLSVDFTGNFNNEEDVMDGRRSSAMIFKADHLPYNGFKVIPVPSPTGGVLVISPNAVIHIDQLSQTVASVNKFFGMENSFAKDDGKKNHIYNKEILSDYSHLGLDLDGSECWFINPDTVILCNRVGDLIKFELVGKEGVGQNFSRKKSGVRSIIVTPLGIKTVQPSCVSTLGLNFSKKDYDYLNDPQYIFLGSATSDSYLLKITNKLREVANPLSTTDSQDTVLKEPEDMEDDDLFNDIYESSKETESATNSSIKTTQVVSFSLKITSKIVSLSPLRSTVLSIPNQYSDDFQYDTAIRGNDLEMVSCAGEGNGGSLVVFQKNLRPCIETSFEFPGVDDMWSLRMLQSTGKEKTKFHKFLVLSKGSSTSVIKTGEDFEEIKGTAFYTKGKTVCCEAVFGGTCIVQVYMTGIVLLDSACSIYSNSPTKNLLHYNPSFRSIPKQKPRAPPTISTTSIKKKRQSNLSATPRSATNNIPAALQTPIKRKSTMASTDYSLFNIADRNIYEDDEDVVDYGVDDEEYEGIGGDDQMIVDGGGLDRNGEVVVLDDDKDILGPVKGPVEVWVDEKMEVKFGVDTFFVVFVDFEGNLQIMKLANLESCFLIKGFNLLPKLLVEDSFNDDQIVAVDQAVLPDDNQESQITPVEIKEILFVNLGSDPSNEKLYLFAVNSLDDVIIYQSFYFTCSSTDSQISIRFARVEHSPLTRSLNTYEDDTHGDKRNPSPKTAISSKIRKQLLRVFQSLGGDIDISPDRLNKGEEEEEEVREMSYQGVFVCGKNPVFLMMAKSSKKLYTQFDAFESAEGDFSIGDNLLDEPSNLTGFNTLRVHRFGKDSRVLCFAEFDNISCRNGYIYYTEKGLLRICTLLPHFNYDHQAINLKLKLGRTPHKLSYHSESRKHVMASSVMEDFFLAKAKYSAGLAAAVIEADDEEMKPKESELVMEQGAYFPKVGKYSLELVSPVTWETVDRHEMEEYEMILALESLVLDTKQTETGSTLFLVVGTGYVRGENLATRGRILIYDIIEVVPEMDNPQTNHKLKLLYVSDEKSPVTAVAAINGYLIAAIGSKIIIHTFENSEELNGVAFLDVNLFVTSIAVVKNLILLGDVIKSVQLLAFQEDPPKITSISKDFNSLSINCLNCIVDETDLSFIVADSEKNLQIFQYAPYDNATLGGVKLLRKGDFHLGSEVSSLVRLRKLATTKDLATETEEVTSLFSREHFNIVAAFDGRVSVLTPIPERMYRRLYALYARMVNQIQHLCGLNPRGFRQVQNRVKPLLSNFISGPPGAKGVLDGDFLYQFCQLSLEKQESLVNGIGSNCDVVFDDLIEINQFFEYF